MAKQTHRRVFVVVVYSKKFQGELAKIQSYPLWTRLRGNEITTLGGIQIGITWGCLFQSPQLQYGILGLPLIWIV